MADGQLISLQFAGREWPSPMVGCDTTMQFQASAGALQPAAYHARRVSLQARNDRLQEALEHQQVKSADLRRILGSLNIPIVSVCSRLTLRYFTAEAGVLLGITQSDIGKVLACAAPLDPEGALMARVRVVLNSGAPEALTIEMASGRRFLCKLLPLQSFPEVGPVTLGVTVTIVAANAHREAVASSDAAAPEPYASGAGTAGRRLIADDHTRFAIGDPAHRHGLTARQQQILSLVLAGQPSKNIAADLGISQRTVENHRAAIMQRTGATSLPALARLAIGADVRGDCKELTVP
jgi:DNA-binding CsgD family transcriptional regulator